MRKILLTSLLGLIVTVANAQETGTNETGLAGFINKYRISLTAGIGSSNLKPTSTNSGGNYNYTVSKIKGRTSYALGLSAEKRIDRRYSIYTGLSMEWLGGTILADKPVFTAADSNEYARSANYTYKLQYLNVPIGLKLKATSIEKFTVYGLVGLDLGIPIGRKANYTVAKYIAADSIANTGEKIPFASIVPISLAYQVGIGSEFKITEDNSAYCSILYRNGFIDHTNPEKLGKAKASFKDGIVRSNNLSFRVGFFF